jgi:hypothetical protein
MVWTYTRIPRALSIALVMAGCSGGRPTPDASDVDAPHASFRVVVQERFGLLPGAGFSFRAESADGQVVEGTTDAQGWAAPSLDALSGRWDLTVARQHYPAVSILGIDGPLHGDVLIRRSEATDGAPTHQMTVRVDGIPDLSQPGIELCPLAFLDTGGAHIVFSEGTVGLDVWAIQRTGNLPGDALVNFAGSGPIALATNDVSVTLRLPTPPARIVRSTVRVQFPSTGLLAPAFVPVDPGFERFWRGGDEEQHCAAANASWTPPDSSGVGTWTIDSFDVDGTQPTTLAVLAGLGTGLGASIQIHTVTDGALVTIAPVTSTPELVDDGGWPRVRSSASEVDYLQLSAGADALNVHARWDAYTFDGSPTDHRLPSLPTGMTVGDLVEGYGFGGVTTLVANTVCGLRLASGPPPWAPGASHDLRVCDSTTSVRFGSP